MNSIRVLAVASAGGHWQQLMRISDGLSGGTVTYACTSEEHAQASGIVGYEILSDYNQDQPIRVLMGLIEAFRLVRRVKPAVAISTGAAPGITCLFWAKIFGAKTIWIDSIANSERLSLSGRIAMLFCTTVLTQWEHLEKNGRPAYRGSVI